MMKKEKRLRTSEITGSRLTSLNSSPDMVLCSLSSHDEIGGTDGTCEDQR